MKEVQLEYSMHEARVMLAAVKTMLFNLDPHRNTDDYEALQQAFYKLLAGYEKEQSKCQIH